MKRRWVRKGRERSKNDFNVPFVVTNLIGKKKSNVKLVPFKKIVIVSCVQDVTTSSLTNGRGHDETLVTSSFRQAVLIVVSGRARLKEKKMTIDCIPAVATE